MESTTILIIDPDAPSRNFLAQFFRKKDYQVSQAAYCLPSATLGPFSTVARHAGGSGCITHSQDVPANRPC